MPQNNTRRPPATTSGTVRSRAAWSSSGVIRLWSRPSEDGARRVSGGLRVLLGDLLDPGDERGDLVGRRSREGELVGHQGVELGAVQRDAVVGGQLVQQLV